ncbi:hypothetical protein DYB34_000825 [Aphanomyces astaci]|uniref:Fibronectin type-III domain-containing protein n=2 Tax=Aphanomyces astaci TaxID=112090 RepID=A0A418C036_APHAT|nr:hypothetical protein DYB34_000825 [Aphanomyces astaci]
MVHTEITSLAPDTSYNGSIVVRNEFGLYSTVVWSFAFSTTSASAPSTPQRFFAFETTGGMLHFTWSTPINEGGAGKVTYVVECDGMDGDGATPSVLCSNSTTSCKAVGLMASTAYIVSVRAQNRLGSSDPTTLQQFTTTFVAIFLPSGRGQAAVIRVRMGIVHPPGAPTAVLVLAKARSVVVLFQPSCDTGGSTDVQGFYSWEAVPTLTSVGPPNSVVATKAANFTLNGLNPGSRYRLLVWATSVGGTSPTFSLDVITHNGIPTSAGELSLSVASSTDLDVIVSPPPNFPDDVVLSLVLKITNIVNGTVSWKVLDNTTLSPSHVRLFGLNPATEYSLQLTAQSNLGTSAPTTTVMSTLPSQPGYVSLQDTSLSILNGSSNVMLWLNRCNGSQGTIVVSLEFATTPAMHPSCSCADSCVCDFTSVAPKTTPLPPSVVFSPSSPAKSVLLRTWNSAVVDQVPHVLRVTLTSNSSTAGPNNSCLVLLYGNPGSISAVMPNYTTVDTTGTFYIPLVRRNGSSGNVMVTLSDVVRIMNTTDPSSGDDNESLPFNAWNTSIVLAPRQVNGSFGLFNIVPSVTYTPFGRQYVLTFDTNATLEQSRRFQVTLLFTDDPTVLKPPLPIIRNEITLQRATGTMLSLTWPRPAYPVLATYKYTAEIAGPYQSNMVDPRQMNWSSIEVSEGEDVPPEAAFFNLVPQSVYFVRVTSVNDAYVGPTTTAHAFWTTTPGPASQPLGLTISRITGGSMAVAWWAPMDTSGLAIESYVINVYVNASSLIRSATTSATSYVVSNLVASTLYTILVGANTKFPAVSFASAANRTVVGGTVPAAPFPAQVQQVTGGSLTLLIAPSDDTGGYAITKYTLYISPAGKNDFTIACSSGSTSCTVNRLAQTTDYDVVTTTTNRVVRQTNSGCPVARFRTTTLTVPSSPLNLQLVGATATTVWLKWTAPQDFGGSVALVGYQIRMQTYVAELNVWTPFELASTLLPLDGLSTQGKVVNLTSQTLYSFALVAMNPISTCTAADNYVPSGPVTVQTSAPGKPQPPTDVVLVGTSGGSMSLTWSPPLDDGGMRITAYAVYAPGLGRLATVNDTLFMKFGLQANTTYSYWVTAITSQGESVPSGNVSGMTTSISAPSAPLRFVQVGAAGGQVVLNWDPPVDDGGAAVFGYNLYRDGALLTSLPSTTSYTDSNGLHTNQTYMYGIAALNPLSEGDPTTLTAFTDTTPGTPQAPLLTIIGRTGGMVSVLTTLPTDMGGAPLESLQLQLFDTESHLLQQLTSEESLELSFYGLASATVYNIQGQVVVTGGGSSNGAMIQFMTTNTTVPMAPPTPILWSANGGNIQLSLTQPMDRGGETCLLILSHISLATNEFERLPFQVSTSDVVTVKGLDATTTHQFWATAVNSAGESSSSPTMYASTIEMSVPEQVGGAILVTGTTYRSVSISWNEVVDIGGDDTANVLYNVSISSSKGGTRYVSTSWASLTIGNLTAQTTYTLQVQAINSIGCGVWSSPSTATTDYAVPGVLQFVSQTVQVFENMTTVTLSVGRTSGTANTISCAFTASSGTATTPTNYILPDLNSLEFVDGVTSQTITVQIVNNDVVDPPRYFDVTLSSILSETGSLGSNKTCRVVILDEGDAGQIWFSDVSYTILESQATALLTLRRSMNYTSGTVSIQPKFRQAQTAVTFSSPTVIFDGGQTTATLTLATRRDGQYNYPYRTATIDLSIAPESAGDIGYPDTATVYIVDDVDVAPPDDLGYVPVQLDTSGGRMVIQVPPPRHVGGLNQLVVSYRTNMTDSSGRLVSIQSQNSSVFTFVGLNFSTRYTFASSVTNRAGLVSNGSGPVSWTTGPMSLPSSPTNIRVVGATGGSIDVCWGGPLDAGGIPISGYQIQYADLVVYNNTALCAHLSNLALQANTTYPFSFSAINLVGVGVPVIAMLSTAMNASLPNELGSPTSVVQVGGDSLMIQLPLPADTGGTDVLRYLIYINTTNSSDQTTTTTVFTEFAINTTRCIVLPRLTAETTYAVRYTAWNKLGGSNVSGTFMYITGPATIPSEPTNLRLDRSLNSTGACIPLRWDPPTSNGGIALAEYHLYVAKSPTNGNAMQTNLTFTEVYVGPASVTSTIACGFDQRSSYVFKAVAFNSKSFCFGSASDMPFSPVLVASTTNASVPSRPDTPQVVSSTGGMVTLAWSVPKDSGGTPLTSFDVNLIASNGSMLVQRLTGSDLTYDVAGLDEFKTYEFQLVARNGIGESAPSPIAFGRTTAATSPTKPLNLTAVNRTGGSLFLSWQPPQDSGGRPIASYFVYRDTVRVGDSQGSTYYLDQANLQADTTYAYFIIAYTNIAYGRQSDTLVTKTAAGTLPNSCTDVTVHATGGSLSVSWVAPQNSGGVPIISYTSVLRLGGKEVGRLTTAKPTATFSLLQFTTTYVFVVNATNTVGSGPAAQAVLKTTNSSVPGAPTSPPTLVSVFGGNATLSMDVPPDTGGETTRLNFLVYQNGQLVLSVPAYTTTGTLGSIYGLTANTVYQIRYACSNVVGAGPSSPVLEVATSLANAPGIMRAPTVAGTTSRTLRLNWIRPVDSGGNAVLRYEVDAGGSSWIFVNVTGGVVTSLLPETVYNVRVRAVSTTTVAQPGLWSPYMQISTAPASAGIFSFGVAMSSVLKNASTFAFPISRLGGSVGAVSVTLTTTRSDLIGTQLVLNRDNPTASRLVVDFDDGVVQVIVEVGIINDRVYVADGVSIDLKLVDPTNFAVLSSDFNVTTLVLLDAGAAGQISFASASASVLESASVIVLPLTRTGGASSVVQVVARASQNAANSSFSSAVIGADFRLPSTPIRFDDGETKANVSVIIRNNNVYNFPSLTFTLQLVTFSGGASIGENSTVIVTLLDDGDSSPPSAPGRPTLESVTGGAVELFLTEPANKGYKNAAVVMYLVSIVNSTSTTVLYPSAKTSWVGGFLANSNYALVVQAANDAFNPIRYGASSPVLSFTTGNPSMNGPATSLRVVASTGGLLSMAWSDPVDTGGVPIQRYRVKWIDGRGIVQLLPSPVRSGGSVTMTWTPPDDTGGINISRYFVLMKLWNETNFYLSPNQFQVEPTRYTVSGLYAQTAYNFRVLAQNTMGHVLLPGLFNISSKASVISASADVGTSWIRPGTAILIGAVTSNDDDASPVAGQPLARNETFRITGLEPQHWYRLRGLALNSFSTCTNELAPTSPSIEFQTTAATIPDPPENLVVVLATGAGFSFGWDPPMDTGGVHITQYTLQLFNESTQAWKTVYANTTTSCRVAKLATKTWYRWRMQATNIAGTSNYSPTYSFQTSVVSAPGPCRQPNQKAFTGGMISVTWDPPDDNGGSDIVSYILEYYNQVGGPSLRVVSKSTSANVFGLRASTSYTMKVTAVNRIGAGESGAEGTLSTGPPSPPEVPEPPVITESSGGALKISMKAPLDIGGVDPASLFYEIYANGYLVLNISYAELIVEDQQSSGGTSQRRLQSQSNGVTVGGLDSNTKYQISVAASSPAGSSPKSIQHEMATSSATVPGAPAAPYVIQANGGSLVIGWTSPADEGGASVSLFQLYIGSNASTPACEGLVWQCTVTGLMSNSAFEFYVVAQNSIGASSPSGILQAKTSLLSALGAPQALRLVSLTADGHGASIAWSPPLDTGGLLVSGYTCTAEHTFSRFNVECDHDVVTVEHFPYDGTSILWSGGCTRAKTFSLYSAQPNASLKITLASDPSVQNSGFELMYRVDADPPSSVFPSCPQKSGQNVFGFGNLCTITAAVGFTGEDCSNYVICCTDPTVCHDQVCDMRPQDIILVSTTSGDDVEGTGELMGVGDVGGTAPKPFATLTRAMHGGGIYSDQSAITMTSSSITNCSALHGGGIFATTSQLSLASTFISSNRATDGAGVYVTGTSEVRGDGAIIAGNVADNIGGGVVAHGVAIVSGVTIASNSATFGGGVSFDGQMDLGQVLVDSNRASRFGGGVYTLAELVLTATDVVVSNNAAVERGGGLYLHNTTCSIVGSGCLFQSNAAQEGGGAYVDASHASWDHVVFNACNATTTGGGGIATFQSDLFVSHSTVDGNFARLGGGLCASGDSKVTLVEVDIVNNVARFGGGMAIDRSEVVGGVLRDNLATEGGGGIFLSDGMLSAANIDSSATLGHGGGVYVTESAFNSLTNVHVTEATSSGNGGGMYCENSSVALTNVSFVRNNASQHGGGVFLQETTLTGRCYATNCTAALSGGGLSIAGAVGIDAVYIAFSTSILGGGFSAIDAIFVVHHATLEANEARQNGGGGFIRNSQGVLDDWTVRSNEAGVLGGGLMVANSNVQHNQVLVADNQATELGGGIYVDGSEFQPVTPGTLSIVQGNNAYRGGNIALVGASELVGLNATNGLAAYGGGIYVANATCQVEGLVVLANTAFNNGGGVFIQSSTCSVSNTLVRRNGAVYGGGVVVSDGLVQHSNTTIVQNMAGSAGGLFLDGLSTFHLTDDQAGISTTISDNQVCATKCGNGGNIGVFEYSDASLSGLVVSKGSSEYGGAMFVYFGSSAVVTDSSFENNVANFGGAFSAYERTNTSFVNCSFEDNAARTSGGAVYMPFPINWDESSAVSLFQSRLARNKALNGMGGAIYIRNVILAISVTGQSKILMADSHVEGYALSSENSASDGGLINIEQASTAVVMVRTSLDVGYADFGGGVFISDGRLDMTDSTISNCKSWQFGGALYLTSTATVVLSNSSILTSDAMYSGGGVYVEAQSTFTAISSTLENNYADDQGGGIFVAIGSGNVCVLTGCSVRHNIASGLGSGRLCVRNTNQHPIIIVDMYCVAVFGSRDSQVVATNTLFEANGGATFYGTSEGGPLYFESSFATLSDCTIAGNIASNGGALQIQNTADVAVLRCEFWNNTALASGGAMYQTNGVTTVANTSFQYNVAPSGGAIYLDESSVSTWTNVSLNANTADSGGGAYIGGSSKVTYHGGQMTSNRANLGGGIFASENAVFLASSIQTRANVALQSGGAFYLNDTVNVNHTELEFVANAAPLGRDVFWRYVQTSPSYVCAKNCTFDRTSAEPAIATDPMAIRLGWWPPYATSGVPMTSSSLENVTLVWDNATNSSVPWPTVLVVDFYGHRSILDNSTVCRVYKKASELVKIMFLPNSQVASRLGFVSFQNAEVQTDPKEAPFEMTVECRLLLSMYEAKLDYDSLDGLTCHSCPLGANCETIQTVGTGQLTSGVAFPSTQQGYFLADAPPTTVQKLCDIAQYFPSGDPCPGGTDADRLDRMRRCMNDTNFKLHWDENRIFTCSSGFMFYSCPVTEACKGSISKSEVTTHLGHVCQEGYTSPLCGSCEAGYQKMDDGTCIPCDDVSRSAFYGYVTIPILMVVVGLYAIALYLHKDTDKMLMAQARAATEHKTFVPPLSTSKLKPAIRRVEKTVHRTWKRLTAFVKARPFKKKVSKNLFGIQRMALPTVGFNAEKFKILLSFFQIFSNLKDTYQIAWPKDVANLMAAVSKFNFGFMSIPHLDCMIAFNYYGDFRLTLATAAVSFAALYLAFRWGVFVYKRKLHKIPRLCTECGLPNTEISTGTRISAMRQFAMEIERDRHTSKLKKILSRLLLSIEKDEVKNAMPTYTSKHSTCPTSQRISDDALRRKIVHTNIQLWQARVKLRFNFRTYSDKCMKIFFWLALFMYPSVSQKVLNMFNCAQVGLGSFLVSDMTLQCTDGY